MLYRVPFTLRIPNTITINIFTKFPFPKSKYSTKTTAEFPKNAIKDYISAHHQPEKGAVYDKKPFKITLEAGKRYVWCSCGKSHTQPFCDGTHRIVQLKITLKPVAFKVEETKDYWLCNCKQTSHRPFCDGTHKSKAVEEATSTVRN